MRILIDILHPAHVHFFAAFHGEMAERGHELRVASRRKDVTCELLDARRIPHDPISERRGGQLGLWREARHRLTALDRQAREFRPHVITGCMGPLAVLAGKRRRIPTAIFYNNETATQANRVAQRWATAYITGRSFRGSAGPRHVVHDSYHELAYLHPLRFRPDPGTRSELGVGDDEALILVRFVSLTSSHDGGVHGVRDRTAFVAALAERGRVFVSTEDPWDPGWNASPLPALDRMHHAVAAADLVIGESATVAAEAAVLGVPSIYVADSPRGYLDDLHDRFGLVRREADPRAALQAATALLTDDSSRARWAEGRQRMLQESPDLTGWMTSFFEDQRWNER
ncbi:MAG: hypothetical protein DHS20C21_18740 [Gemmatimonadota bacterium]|nr:MAG: hypothetical protein DHS20C21_18740 [Gemmatimonadota bacterium]